MQTEPMGENRDDLPDPLDEMPVDVAIEPKRPDITLAQKVAAVPVISEFAHAWGIYSMSQPQQDSLEKMVYWAIGLVGADAIIRFGRNLAQR